MKIKFLQRHPYKPNPNQTTIYQQGMLADLPKATAEKLIADGKAEAVSSDEAKSKRSASK